MTESSAAASVEVGRLPYGSTAGGGRDVVASRSRAAAASGVIGESGAGKTQAFLAVMGLLPANARVTGSARLDGVDSARCAAPRVRGRRSGDDLPGSR